MATPVTATTTTTTTTTTMTAAPPVKAYGRRYTGPVAAGATIYGRPLPAQCTAFGSDAGRALMASAMRGAYMECYFNVAAQFHTQQEPAYCGLATLVVVLNALNIDPGVKWKGVWRWYSEEMLDCCVPLDVVQHSGINYEEYVCLARCNGLAVDAYRYGEGDFGEQTFRGLVKRACASRDTILSLTYSRASLGQTGDGHFSPVGGYDEASDSVLVMDVARYKYPPYWVKLPDLYESMRAADKSTGRARGCFVMRNNAVLLELGESRSFRFGCGMQQWRRHSTALKGALAAAAAEATGGDAGAKVDLTTFVALFVRLATEEFGDGALLDEMALPVAAMQKDCDNGGESGCAGGCGGSVDGSGECSAGALKQQRLEEYNAALCTTRLHALVTNMSLPAALSPNLIIMLLTVFVDAAGAEAAYIPVELRAMLAELKETPMLDAEQTRALMVAQIMNGGNCSSGGCNYCRSLLSVQSQERRDVFL